MFLKIFTAAASAAVIFISADSRACTLWGAAGNTAGGGTIISKNRDWKPDHVQSVKIIHPKKGYSYLGLFAEDSDEPGIKMGVNEKGLCVLSASASSIPKKMRDNQPAAHGKISEILSKFGSTDEVMANRKKIFSTARANFYMISDRTKILTVEVGLNGGYAVKETVSDYTAHTNYYLEKSLSEFNIKTGKSSTVRLNRISELLKRLKPPFTAAKFAEISRDRNDGPDNSLWRTGTKESTLASWIIRTPSSGDPLLRLVIANPGEKEILKEYILNDSFWKSN